MKILFNDIIQYSDAPKEIKSPSLADYSIIDTSLKINFDKPRSVNSIGIGNTNAKNISIVFNDSANTIFNIQFTENGLYLMSKTINTSQIIITINVICGNADRLPIYDKFLRRSDG